MAFLIYVILFAIVLLFSYSKFHRALNFVSIFSGIWLIFGGISTFGLHGVRIPSLRVHMYVWIFVSIVDIIFLLFASNKKIETQEFDYSINIKTRAKQAQIVGLLLGIPIIIKVATMIIGSGDLASIRLLYFSGTMFESVYQDLLFRTFPIVIFNSLVIVYSYYSVKTREYKYLIYALLNSLLVTVVNGGRYSLLSLLYCILIMWAVGFINANEIQLSQKFKSRIKKIGILIVVIMAFVTVIRGQDLLKNIVLYFSGSLSYLDYILDNPASFGLDKPLYGYLTFAPIIEPFVLLFKVLGLTTAKVPSYEFNIYAQEYYNIGTAGNIVQINANTSVLYHFLRDFGAWGIVIGGVFLGTVAVWMYNKWQRGSMVHGVWFLYVGIALLNSLMTYQLLGSAPMMIIIASWLLCKRPTKIRIK